jgi:hypothetical protein
MDLNGERELGEGNACHPMRRQWTGEIGRRVGYRGSVMWHGADRCYAEARAQILDASFRPWSPAVPVGQICNWVLAQSGRPM